jgi:hypothetical protein
MAMAKAKRPDMREYFKARIDFHVNGMLARSYARAPAGVQSINGDVTDSVITATMTDGTRWHWSGGQYANRKVNGCYAPLMPKPVHPSR